MSLSSKIVGWILFFGLSFSANPGLMRLASHGSMPLKRGSLISSSRMGATSEGAGCTLAARLKPGFGPRRLGSATSAVGATGAAAAGVETGGASAAGAAGFAAEAGRSDEHTSELQSLMRISYAVFCYK